MLQKAYKILFWSGYSAVLIVSGLSIPWALDKVHIGVPSFNIRLDHLLHMLVYFLITGYFFVGHLKGLLLFRSNSLRNFFIAVVLLATVSEGMQLWVPTRSFNPMDWMANMAGMVVGFVVFKNSFYNKIAIFANQDLHSRFTK